MSAAAKPAKVLFPPDLPFSVEDPKKLAALGHVLGCSEMMAREVLKIREDSAAQWERIEALERMNQSLLKLLMDRKK